MMNREFRWLIIALAIIGATAVVIVLAMWLMHLSMMNGGMMTPGDGR